MSIIVKKVEITTTRPGKWIISEATAVYYLFGIIPVWSVKTKYPEGHCPTFSA